MKNIWICPSGLSVLAMLLLPMAACASPSVSATTAADTQPAPQSTVPQNTVNPTAQPAPSQPAEDNGPRRPISLFDGDDSLPTPSPVVVDFASFSTDSALLPTDALQAALQQRASLMAECFLAQDLATPKTFTVSLSLGSELGSPVVDSVSISDPAWRALPASSQECLKQDLMRIRISYDFPDDAAALMSFQLRLSLAEDED